MLAPFAILQMLLQQSEAREQMSPFWMQYDAPIAHWPSLHSLEQHCALS
jgi:hypothetical protein